MQDVKDSSVIMNNAFSKEKKSTYQFKLNNEWGDYVKNVNRDFFDSNKLYIKSMHDYRTKMCIKTKKPKDLDHISSPASPYKQEK